MNKNPVVCTCKSCLRAMRYSIELAFMLERRALGMFTLRAVADLSWVPWPLYEHFIGRLCALGILIKFTPSDPNQPVRYLHHRCMAPVRREKGRKP